METGSCNCAGVHRSVLTTIVLYDSGDVSSFRLVYIIVIK